MITELTQKQKDLLPVYKNKWRKIALCTNLADRERAEKAIFWMYKQAKLDKPKIIWKNSPVEISNFISDSVRDSVIDSVRNSVINSVRNSVRNSVCNSVWDSVRDSVRNHINEKVKQ